MGREKAEENRRVNGDDQGVAHGEAARLDLLAGGPNQVISAPRNPVSVPSPTQATYPSGLIGTAAGAATWPRTGSSRSPAYSASVASREVRHGDAAGVPGRPLHQLDPVAVRVSEPARPKIVGTVR